MKHRAKSKPAVERRKEAWLHTLPCCLSGREDIEVAHLHEGELTSFNRKVSFVHTLPLSAILHRAQHRHADVWKHALGENPRPWAERLHDLFEKDEHMEAQVLLWDMQERASREYLGAILRRAVA